MNLEEAIQKLIAQERLLVRVSDDSMKRRMEHRVRVIATAPRDSASVKKAIAQKKAEIAMEIDVLKQDPLVLELEALERVYHLVMRNEYDGRYDCCGFEKQGLN